ncbi:MAG: cytochrome c [Hyphomonas sp.]|uniref:c-type cytochrome n=1 Tax=Hyphomonas sp. TaxID=87 RepID=UPI003526DBB5
MRLLSSAVLGIGALLMSACHSVSPEDAAAKEAALNEIAVGQMIAEANCSRCHAVGRSGDSPHEEAKPFRKFSENYPIRDLEEPLAEGIVVGHPDMPVFTMSPAEIDALLSYIESIQEPLGT